MKLENINENHSETIRMSEGSPVQNPQWPLAFLAKHKFRFQLVTSHSIPERNPRYPLRFLGHFEVRITDSQFSTLFSPQVFTSCWQAGFIRVDIYFLKWGESWIGFLLQSTYRPSPCCLEGAGERV